MSNLASKTVATAGLRFLFQFILDSCVLIAFLKMSLEGTDEIFEKFSSIAGAKVFGSGLKKFLFIKGTRENRVLLVAHADTWWDGSYSGLQSGNCAPAEIFEDSGIIRNKNGGLGADDRAGCAIVWLLKDLGHSILITNGEEHGRQGSNYLVDAHPDIKDEINNDHQFVVQFDRRNARDFKCYRVGTDEFREYVKGKTGTYDREKKSFSEPDFISATDIVTLCRSVCGVNLSVGYKGEHTDDELLVIRDWENTLDLSRKWFSEPDIPRFDLPNPRG